MSRLKCHKSIMQENNSFLFCSFPFSFCFIKNLAVTFLDITYKNTKYTTIKIIQVNQVNTQFNLNWKSALHRSKLIASRLASTKPKYYCLSPHLTQSEVFTLQFQYTCKLAVFVEIILNTTTKFVSELKFNKKAPKHIFRSLLLALSFSCATPHIIHQKTKILMCFLKTPIEISFLQWKIHKDCNSTIVQC